MSALLPAAASSSPYSADNTDAKSIAMLETNGASA